MNIDLQFNKKYCNFFLKKNGKIKNGGKKFYYYYYHSILCIYNVILNNNNFNLILFPHLYEKNENDMIRKLYIYFLMQKKNFKYILINSNNFKYSRENKILIFKDEKNKDTLLEYIFLASIKREDNIYIYDYFYKNLSKKLITSFLRYKLFIYNKLSNKKIFVILFYNVYIYLIEDELEKKYKKRLNHFENFNTMYIFLKEKGYVDKYYNYYSIKMIKYYRTYYDRLKYFIQTFPHLEEYKKDIQKRIKNFNEINLLKIIDKCVHKPFNKEYIKNKFIEITKNYNI
jgi:hypothetical protein